MTEPGDISPERVKENVEWVSENCGLRKDFLTDLLLEPNDWSFVIKAHALVESVICQLIAANLNEPRMEFYLAQEIQMENRIKLLKTLGLVDEGDRKMLRLFGKIRNNLVHNVGQTDFKFSEYLKNKDNRRNFAESFGTLFPDPIPGPPPIPRADYVLQQPRLAIWSSVMGLIVLTLTAKAKAVEREAMRKLRRRLTSAVDSGTGDGDKSRGQSGHSENEADTKS